MKTHPLKIWTHWYDDVSTGRMNFQIRTEQDRVFQAGDQLELRAWDQERGEHAQGYSPLYVTITAVYRLPGLQPGYVALAIRLTTERST